MGKVVNIGASRWLHKSRIVTHRDLVKAAGCLDIKPAAIWAGEKETTNVGLLPTGRPVIRINQEYFDSRIGAIQNVIGDIVHSFKDKSNDLLSDQEWLIFAKLRSKNESLAIASTGFGRWQVQG